MTQPATTTSVADAWTIQRVLSWASDDFEKRDFESPRLEAELLLAHALATTRIRLIVDSARPLSAEELERFKQLIKRRRSNEPIAYILGQREFYGLPIRVDRRVLVPRPDTETLVEVALEQTQRLSEHGLALDLCTGSGCVALAFKSVRRTWDVTVSDVSEGALEVVRDNAQRLGQTWNLRMLRGSLFEPLGAAERYDLVTANPPYIPSRDLAHLEAHIRDFEPRGALDGGADGLEIVGQIIARAPGHLRDRGVLALEIGSDQGERVMQLFRERGFDDVTLRRDYGQRDRVVSGVWNAR